MPRRGPAVRPDEPLEFTAEERERLRRDYLAIYNDGARTGFLLRFPGPRTASGFPADFHFWRDDWRRAWLAGFDHGLHDLIRGVWVLPARGERR
jgi:hypothetical protein